MILVQIALAPGSPWVHSAYAGSAAGTQIWAVVQDWHDEQQGSRFGLSGVWLSAQQRHGIPALDGSQAAVHAEVHLTNRVPAGAEWRHLKPSELSVAVVFWKYALVHRPLAAKETSHT